MAHDTTHTGGCHCGEVRYEVTLDLTQPVVECNCSICEKRGLLLAFAKGDAFRLVAGEAALTDYQFGKKRIRHLFCARCGVESFARGTSPDGTPTFAVNVRCLDGVELGKLARHPYDGRSA